MPSPFLSSAAQAGAPGRLHRHQRVDDEESSVAGDAPARVVNSQLVTAEEAAALLSVPKTWVLAEARADRIPHVRLGRYVRFEPAQVQAWWEARRRGPHPAGRSARRRMDATP